MNSNEWRSCELGDLVMVKGGKRLPKGKKLQEIITNHPYIRVTDMGNRVIDKTKLLYIPDEVFNSISQYIVKDGDIIVSIVGTIGLISQITDELDKASLSENCAKLTKFKNILPEYLYYYLISDNCQNEIKSKTVGTTQPKLPLYNIKSLEVRLPPLSIQRKIVDILSTIDDKIELNAKTNYILEEIAQTIFKRWFIENKESSGWELKTLPELVEINPIRKLKINQMAPYLDMASMPTAGHRVTSWKYRPYGSGTKFINGDTLIAKITPCLENGKTAFVDFLEDGQVGWGSTEYIILRPKPPIPLEYGYFLARSDEIRNYAIQNMTGTSGRQRVPITCLNYLTVSIPPIDLTNKFGVIAQSIMEKIKNNSEESASLASIRDNLLPKFLNGEIEI